MNKTDAIETLQRILEDQFLVFTKDPEAAQEEAEEVIELLEVEGFFESNDIDE